MQGLRVTPARAGGRNRLYVNLPGGRTVAWYDPDNGRISVVLERYRDDALAALAPYTTGDLTVGPPPVPSSAELARLALHPDDDLAPNRPGEALYAELDLRPPPALPRLRKDPRRADLAAQQRLGDALDRLEGAGWRTVHCVPLPGADRIDHLAVGPGGVLAVRALAAQGTRVRVAGPVVRVGRGPASGYAVAVRRRAERAARALATAVRPVLAVVGAARLETEAVPQDVRILRDDEVPALARLGGVLKPADIEALYATARDRRTWLGV
ncbi:NERD domain-containing protein [Streptomyces sp. ISL-10]|uniref:NERD domain-containing protein n=1 Tax=Streptomyces sp. ISL-10 TaxID=2819172 RepID=UPI001BEBDEF8|nr:NERD domain-containing protein [Streptomyces sp. ISL-10]MBT2365360.1 NERD domain-containing protein [Streptomyces sp. ISL-10]